jgi:site-specific DNA-methyltransferase (adenine-specific)
MMYDWRGFPYPAKGWRYSKSTIESLDADGRIWYPTKSDGSFDTKKRPRPKRYLDEMEGAMVGTVWTDIPPINSRAQERLGYPTQKPESLLERIVKASTNEGDVILDAFCGCGTAISVAERLDRRWIGIDVTHLAIALIRHRLQYAFKGQLSPYTVGGDPKDLEGARELALLDRYQFEWWALGLVDARPAHDKRKGADKGIDGHIYFFVDFSDVAQKAVVQVKSGHVTRNMIGDLNNARQRERAEIAVFVTLEPATDPMKKEVASAGIYQIQFSSQKIPRVQVFTIEDLLNGRRPQFPAIAQPDTYKKPPAKQKGTRAMQGHLFKKQGA